MNHLLDLRCLDYIEDVDVASLEIVLTVTELSSSFTVLVRKDHGSRHAASVCKVAPGVDVCGVRTEEVCELGKCNLRFARVVWLRRLCTAVGRGLECDCFRMRNGREGVDLVLRESSRCGGLIMEYRLLLRSELRHVRVSGGGVLGCQIALGEVSLEGVRSVIMSNHRSVLLITLRKMRCSSLGGLPSIIFWTDESVRSLVEPAALFCLGGLSGQ